jgi:hypothetical protein
MTNKFKIGSVWKTRGGWRAVVVDNNGKYVTVWHKKKRDVLLHNQDGTLCDCPGDFDLIEPWVEPKVRDVWVNVHEDSATAFLYETKEDADYGRGVSCIACINVKFKEGEGL